MKSNIVVVIPVYKQFEDLELFEISSLRQGLTVLNSREIAFIAPESLDVSPYINEASRFGVSCIVKKFKDQFFSGINGYNRLMTSIEFYIAFKSYCYILIYQLDCWVFRDELDVWCAKGYDYIGAPWVDNNNLNRVFSNEGRALLKVLMVCQRVLGIRRDWKVGNGGFSLRKVGSFIEALRLFRIKAQRFQSNEDLFWSIYLPLVYPFFKVPNERVALGFAFEEKPERFYKENNFKLPFGCHAWQKYNYNFWKQWITL